MLSSLDMTLGLWEVPYSGDRVRSTLTRNEAGPSGPAQFLVSVKGISSYIDKVTCLSRFIYLVKGSLATSLFS